MGKGLNTFGSSPFKGQISNKYAKAPSAINLGDLDNDNKVFQCCYTTDDSTQFKGKATETCAAVAQTLHDANSKDHTPIPYLKNLTVLTDDVFCNIKHGGSKKGIWQYVDWNKPAVVPFNVPQTYPGKDHMEHLIKVQLPETCCKDMVNHTDLEHRHTTPAPDKPADNTVMWVIGLLVIAVLAVVITYCLTKRCLQKEEDDMEEEESEEDDAKQ